MKEVAPRWPGGGGDLIIYSILLFAKPVHPWSSILDLQASAVTQLGDRVLVAQETLPIPGSQSHACWERGLLSVSVPHPGLCMCQLLS